jgi:endopeptidase Clp ATP-binding regulatory subunit ClpX
MTEKQKLPKEKDLEKELGEYLSNKYGSQVKIVSAGMLPFFNGERLDEQDPKQPLGFDFRLKPAELVSYLDEYVVSQQEAKDVLSTKICTHFNRIQHEIDTGRTAKGQVGRIKANVLLLGPTGVGKTYLVKLIAQKIGVPFVKGDATKFSETGYVGGDVEDLIRDLVREADNDIGRAEFGIVYVDEIDKIATNPNRIGADVSRAGVQRAFLKPMEETDVEMKVPHDPVSQMEALEQYRLTGKREKKVVNTRNILFVMSGAFAGLTEVINKRCSEHGIGFGSRLDSKQENPDVLQKVKAEDLINYGFESEFVGRLPVVAALNSLSKDDFIEILQGLNSSVVLGKKQDFNGYGIKLQFEQEAFVAIAEKAVAEKTGARGLLSVMESVLLGFEKNLPSTSMKYLVVSADLVHHPRETLEKLLAGKTQAAKHKKRYEELRQEEYDRIEEVLLSTHSSYLFEHGLQLTDQRIQLMINLAQDEILDIRDVCDEFIILVDYIRDYGMTASEECNINITFEEEAIDRILSLSSLTLDSVSTICEKMFTALDYGLRLIGQKTENGEMIIPVSGVETPEKFINETLDENFKL